MEATEPFDLLQWLRMKCSNNSFQPIQDDFCLLTESQEYRQQLQENLVESSLFAFNRNNRP